MKRRGYFIFHLNLAFSSIEEESWTAVIKNCYHPLLNLIEKTGIPIGIELSGWTLKQINRVDKSFIKRLKNLLKTNACELIGSGYCQIVGPLVPYKVNEWNQKLGRDTYQKILNQVPDIVLVNEMAFSSSMVDLYKQFNFKGLIMDRDNIKLSLNSENVPTHAKGINNSELPILWSDTILFQKLQFFAHGDISIKSYIDFLKKRIKEGETLFPLYCNDAEIFDFRPGRFNEERPTHHDGEWKRIENLIEHVSSNIGLDFVSPSAALKINKKQNKLTSKLVSTAHPIPVKKQSKYNISRWAVTGVNDLWLNTMCHRIAQQFHNCKTDNLSDWRDLCELWASDLRTHITNRKWNKAKSKLASLLKRHNINNNFRENSKKKQTAQSLKTVLGNFHGANISRSEDGILLLISTKKIRLELNVRRGLAIQSLAFSSHKMQPCIGTLSHGHFSSISLGADFYSGGLVVELPIQRIRFADLENVKPKFFIKTKGNIEIGCEIRTPLGSMIKLINISLNDEKISLKYLFPKWNKITGSIRLGFITLLEHFSNENTVISLLNGGKENELFKLKGEFNHTEPASTLVSCSRGLGATNGKIKINNKKKFINLTWDPSKCAVMPMLHRTTFKDKVLSRILFSMKEIDDTAKLPSNVGDFLLNIDAHS